MEKRFFLLLLNVAILTSVLPSQTPTDDIFTTPHCTDNTNAFDSLGDACLADGKTARARKYYQQN